MPTKDSSKTEPQTSPAADCNPTVTSAGDKKKNPVADATSNKSRVEQAEARAEQAESRTEQAKTRAELAETRTEQAESRTEQAKTRTEQAEIRTEQAETRTEQAETALEQVASKSKDVDLQPATTTRLLQNQSTPGNADQKSPLEQLTERQREILQLIAEGQNTKQIADLLKVSPKTVEYHRMKLMAGLNLHDVAGLVRFAVRVGLITPEN